MGAHKTFTFKDSTPYRRLPRRMTGLQPPLNWLIPHPLPQTPNPVPRTRSPRVETVVDPSAWLSPFPSSNPCHKPCRPIRSRTSVA